ncbi:Calcium uniporter protein, mitochondrial [Halotydeus destructor]|nr:Calcium uniporter protein, mitochondrial [Halotydeus destructor]
MSRSAFNLIRLVSRANLHHVTHCPQAVIVTKLPRRNYCQNNGNLEPTSSLDTGLECPSTPQSALETIVTFSNGVFRFTVANRQYILSYWTPINMLPEVVTGETMAVPVEDLVQSNQDASVPTKEEACKNVVRIFDMNDVEVGPSAELMALGFAFSESNTILFDFATAQQPFRLSFAGRVDELKKWEANQVPPMSFEAQVLERQRIALLSSYQPMCSEFKNILMKAENQANSKFKWGGLFLLSAQLGFVARLTWFEYSWDIMEPITWCLTYSMLMASFAYYIMTSQEYMLPMVERRFVQTQLWKHVKKSNFNIEEFKKMRQDLLTLEQKMKKSKVNPYSSLSNFPF